MTTAQITSLLGQETANDLLAHTCRKIPKEKITAPSVAAVESTFQNSNRSAKVIENLMRLYNTGRLAGTGYLSIFPVDQGMEHTAGYSFAHNSDYFDPETIVRMSVEGGCSGIASTAGVLGIISKKYADKIPFVVKINHSEHLTLPEQTNQILFSSVEQAVSMGAAAVGATVYFGSENSHRQIQEIAQAFERAHRLGLATILWCYTRNHNYSTTTANHATSVDISSQAIHIAATMGADIVKQKMPTPSFGFKELNFSKYNDEMYIKLLTKHPIDLVRYQVAHAYMGKIPLINSGGESSGESDLADAVKAAIINKRAGGAGLIMGRKVFKRPFAEGVEILQAVQDVYRNSEITIA